MPSHGAQDRYGAIKKAQMCIICVGWGWLGGAKQELQSLAYLLGHKLRKCASSLK